MIISKPHYYESVTTALEFLWPFDSMPLSLESMYSHDFPIKIGLRHYEVHWHYKVSFDM